MARRQLQNKRAIVTGASSGLGRQLVRQFADHGMRVVINARRHEQLQTLAAQFFSRPENCVVVSGDICDERVQHRIVDACTERFGGMDVLVNNAGVGAMGRFDSAAAGRLRDIFEVNFFAAVGLIRKSLELLEQGEDPLIVNIGSVLGHRAVPLKSEYCASKFALHGFSDSLRAELAQGPIELLLVSPSQIKTEFFDSAIEDTAKRDWQSRFAMSPEAVADKILAAMKSRKQEIVFPLTAKLLVWLDRLFPTLANMLMARYAQ